jgi:hypothetical protein
MVSYAINLQELLLFSFLLSVSLLGAKLCGQESERESGNSRDGERGGCAGRGGVGGKLAEGGTKSKGRKRVKEEGGREESESRWHHRR